MVQKKYSSKALALMLGRFALSCRDLPRHSSAERFEKPAWRVRVLAMLYFAARFLDDESC